MKKNMGNLGDTLIQQAIGDAVRAALKAKPVAVHLDLRDDPVICYEIGGQFYTMETAVDKILGQYSWWNEA